MPKRARHKPKAGAARGERTPQGGALAHGRRTEPVARLRRLETQPRCFSATCEHSTEHNSGEAGNERCENYPLALLGGSPPAEGRAACTNDSQQPRPRASLFRRTGRYPADTALACVCARSCQCASRLTFDMSGGWKQAKLAGRRPLDGRVRLGHRAHRTFAQAHSTVGVRVAETPTPQGVRRPARP